MGDRAELYKDLLIKERKERKEELARIRASIADYEDFVQEHLMNPADPEAVPKFMTFFRGTLAKIDRLEDLLIQKDNEIEELKAYKQNKNGGNHSAYYQFDGEIREFRVEKIVKGDVCLGFRVYYNLNCMDEEHSRYYSPGKYFGWEGNMIARGFEVTQIGIIEIG